jgi:hypothetical protein
MSGGEEDIFECEVPLRQPQHVLNKRQKNQKNQKKSKKTILSIIPALVGHGLNNIVRHFRLVL